MLTAMSDAVTQIHATAIIESGAIIGLGSKVWHHAHIRIGALVGECCVIGKNVYIDTQVRVGDRCKLQNNVSLYHGVEILDDVFVGPSTTFTNDRLPRAFNSNWQITPTLVEQGASIGANATIVCGIILHEYCMVAAGATVTRDVNAHQLVGGNPARHLGWVCRCGEILSRQEDAPHDLRCARCSGKGRS